VSIDSKVKIPRKTRLLTPVDRLPVETVSTETLAYLRGRYGLETSLLLGAAQSNDLQPIGALPNLWAELRWAARAEGVIHLDDLLLRRVRLGMLLPQGGSGVKKRIRTIIQQETGWSDARWEVEEAAYSQTWKKYYSPHPG
ncbi:MAG TPA: glycerol-3-phosphate dehydrogenase C-terminal domain-containing protein, partial [Pelolinea sp.]|nr:glycerol-3-phosphate dehydrogenase C-terminal domain-containing protein [Pelolinea sp.]